ncbi:MarR family transcriptional regulator [Nonomuraea sp. NPDC049141]|uniref:MarR family winged helix-turn-helix transcriptional regulator n=1 Tax=Nonomuraea sp. NPDC049141 TaxID=3155500 RepID=UPI0033FD17FC
MEPALPELLTQLFDVADTARAEATATLAEFELSGSQAGMLWALNPALPPVPMRELARRLLCDPSNVTLMSAKLEKAGLVERRPHPSDGRVRVLALTERGVEVWHKLMDRITATSPVLRLSSAERRRLAELLTKIQNSADSPRP